MFSVVAVARFNVEIFVGSLSKKRTTNIYVDCQMMCVYGPIKGFFGSNRTESDSVTY